MIRIFSDDFGRTMLEKVRQLEDSYGIKLTRYQKILLAEIGTVEQVLSIIANSPITVEVLRQEYNSEGSYEREVWLKDEGGNRLVYAKTKYNVNYLPRNMFEDLKSGRIGIGSTMIRHKLETFRRITEIGYDEKSRALSRRYEVIKDGQILFDIYENFSIDLFDEHQG